MKEKVKKIPIVILFLICLCGIGYCGYRIYEVWLDYHTSDIEYENLLDDYIEETPTTIPNKVVTQKDSTYDFQEIDWEGLKKINPDIIGWIRIPNTVVNYPIMQGDSNEKYIHTTFEGKKTSAGALFLDWRNSPRLDDYVSVIYGHNMKNGSMFSMIKSYLKEDFLKENKYIEIYTPKWAKVYTPCFVYTSKYTDKAYDFTIRNDESYLEWLKERNAQSYIKLDDFDVSKNSIVLSTCHGKAGTDGRCLVIIQPTDDFDALYY